MGNLFGDDYGPGGALNRQGLGSAKPTFPSAGPGNVLVTLNGTTTQTGLQPQQLYNAVESGAYTSLAGLWGYGGVVVGADAGVCQATQTTNVQWDVPYCYLPVTNVPVTVTNVPSIINAFPVDSWQQRAAMEFAVAYQRQTDEWVRQQKEARGRAEELLVAQLDAEQKRDYETKSYFDVRVKGRIYRIHTVGSGYQGNIKELNKHGEVLASYCIGLAGVQPAPDHWLAQKIMLEHREKDFLRIANKTRLRR